MSINLTGINNINEYYTNHYFASIFEENAEDTISAWRAKAKDSDEYRTPWARLRDSSRQYYVYHDKEQRGRSDAQIPVMIQDMADLYLAALDYRKANPKVEPINDIFAPIYKEITKSNDAPLLWVILSQNTEDEPDILAGHAFAAPSGDEVDAATALVTDYNNEELATKILFSMDEPPRWLIFVGLHQIALIDRNKWNEKRYLSFELSDIFSRREESTLQAMSVLLHKESLCPDEGTSLLDQLDENSHRHASGVSQDLKFALRESIELLGNEILYDLSHRQGRDLEASPVDAGELTIQCMRYMYRMLFMLFIEARPELGYAPMKAQAYVQGYSLESLRDVADSVREETSAVGDGYFLHETLSKLYGLIYEGYPSTEEELHTLQESESLNDIFLIEPLKAHIFDPELTQMITSVKLRNRVMLRIIDLMSVTRPTGRRNDRRGRISYSTLGINQMGAVYEALLSYRGFIAQEALFEVKRKQDTFNELDVGYFVPESELPNYEEDERVRYEFGENRGKLRKYEKGTFIYRLAGREREKSASYYTPEVLTKCLVKYALKELLEGKPADEILHLTICEPAMGSAAFLNEAINQLAEAYIDKKQKELGEVISYEDRFTQLQKVKMFIADRNVYGIDLNPVAVELAEVSLWLNTIFSGGFVPWFGMQLVCGNSLIGARRQCYTVSQLQATGSHWYESAPERVPVGVKRKPRTQIYHFFAGDTGMATYTDRVIKSLATNEIITIKDWNKRFTKPFSDDDVQTALRLSEVVDKLWEQQVELRREIGEKTSDPISVYGQPADTGASHTTIREKDMIYKKLYLSEEMRNAGPYARLKFAMDYWCALWFWPIDKADLLPTRSEFLADMGFILEGTIDTFASVSKEVKMGQISMFPSEAEQLVMDMTEQYRGMGVVDIPKLCAQQPRLALVRQIAEQNHFMHWELEFADLFAERGGFDLVIGNPPWIKIEWNEQGFLSDEQPLFAIRDLSAAKTAMLRNNIFSSVPIIQELYVREYENMVGQQNFQSSVCNYEELVGVKNNLYKSFLPQAWYIGNKKGFSAFLHPNSIFDDSNGGRFRQLLYPHIRKHFRFENEFKLFQDVGNAMKYSLNIYSNTPSNSFEAIFNLFHPSTIDYCYSFDGNAEVGGIKDNNENWNIEGHRDRVIKIDQNALKLFSKLIDGNDNWKEARMPTLHAKQILEVLIRFSEQENVIDNIRNHIFVADLWNETNAQQDGYILRDVHFPDDSIGLIYSGPHIGGANPLFQASQRDCRTHRAFDNVDLQYISDKYIQRTNYSIPCEISKYLGRLPITNWGNRYNQNYRVISRKMLNLSGERSLISCIAVPNSMHTNGILGLACSDQRDVAIIAGAFASIPYDFFVKTMGRQNIYEDNAGKLPIPYSLYDDEIIARVLLLNCVNKYYSEFWTTQWNISYVNFKWAKSCSRLNKDKYCTLSNKWDYNTPLRSDYERRQALIEIDVLISLALHLTLNQLKTIYRIQFPVLQQYEADTWYDANGRIVFTNNRSLSKVGVERARFESEMKGATAGQKFYRTIIDDTMPGGPIERTIEYIAPFDRCDREQDYETAWKFFEEKYEDKKD